MQLITAWRNPVLRGWQTNKPRQYFLLLKSILWHEYWMKLKDTQQAANRIRWCHRRGQFIPDAEWQQWKERLCFLDMFICSIRKRRLLERVRELDAAPCEGEKHAPLAALDTTGEPPLFPSGWICATVDFDLWPPNPRWLLIFAILSLLSCHYFGPRLHGCGIDVRVKASSVMSLWANFVNFSKVYWQAWTLLIHQYAIIQ